MIALGIDAAGSSGWAIVQAHGGRLYLPKYGVVKAARWREVADVVASARAAGAQVAAIESPYVDKNPDTAIKLGMVVGRWLQECDRAGLPARLWKAQQWQHHLLNGLISPSSPRATRKKAAAMWVASQFKVRGLEDENDAICLASFQAKLSHFEQRAAG